MRKGPTGNIINADINDNSAWFNPRPLDEFSLADGRYNDVGIFHLHVVMFRKVGNVINQVSYDIFHILGTTVTLRDSGVSVFQHRCDGATHNIAPTEDNGVGSGEGYTGGFQKPDDG
jgi:hypothetical protein